MCNAAVLRTLIQVHALDDVAPLHRNVYAALNPGGVIHIIGMVVDDSPISPVGAVGFNILRSTCTTMGKLLLRKSTLDG